MIKALRCHHNHLALNASPPPPTPFHFPLETHGWKTDFEREKTRRQPRGGRGHEEEEAPDFPCASLARSCFHYESIIWQPHHHHTLTLHLITFIVAVGVAFALSLLLPNVLLYRYVFFFGSSLLLALSSSKPHRFSPPPPPSPSHHFLSSSSSSSSSTRELFFGFLASLK